MTPDRHDDEARRLLGHARTECLIECRNCESVSTISAALRSADEAGYRRGWESLADKCEEVACEFGDNPKAVMEIIGEWIGQTRHAVMLSRSKPSVGERGEK